MSQTKLDANQVLKRAFDEITGRLKVDAEVSATFGTAEVVIDHTNDSIKVGDGIDLLVVNPSGSINVVPKDSLNNDLLGQKTMANSMPVTLSSDQDSLLIAGRYNLSPPSVTNGSKNELQLTSAGNLKITPEDTLSTSTSTVYEASRVVKNAPGTLFGLNGYNSSASPQFIQIHNTTLVPPDSAVPILLISVPASSNFTISLPITGRYFSTGISICNSSTGPTKTIGLANCWFDVIYK